MVTCHKFPWSLYCSQTQPNSSADSKSRNTVYGDAEGDFVCFQIALFMTLAKQTYFHNPLQASTTTEVRPFKHSLRKTTIPYTKQGIFSKNTLKAVWWQPHSLYLTTPNFSITLSQGKVYGNLKPHTLH